MMNPTQPIGADSLILYQLLSVTPAATPDGGDGTWFRYVIAQGVNEITGLRCGSAAEVESAVREMVIQLNERSKGNRVKKVKPISAGLAVSNAIPNPS